MRQRHDFTGKMCSASANGKTETCFTLQQAIYRVYDFARSMENKQGWITLPCGTVLEWDGNNWFIMGYNSDE